LCISKSKSSEEQRQVKNNVKWLLTVKRHVITGIT
jgi:hypothetical protein